MHRTTQKSEILKHLEAGNSITPIEALQKFGSLRLADVIFKLKREGHNITTELFTTSNGSRAARYALLKPLKTFIEWITEEEQITCASEFANYT